MRPVTGGARPRRSRRTRAALKDCGDVADPPCSDSRPRRASPEGPRSPAPASCVNAKLTRSCRARANHPRLGRRRTRMTGRFRRWPGSAIHTIRDSLRTAPPRWSPAVASGCRSHASGVPRRASSPECRRPSIGSLEDVQSRFAWIENRTYLRILLVFSEAGEGCRHGVEQATSSPLRHAPTAP